MAEILVALAFMAVMTVGVAGLAVAIIQGNAKSRNMATATYLAQDRLEGIRNTPYANINCGTTSDTPVVGFQRVTSTVCDTPITGVKRITVTVSWTGGSTTGGSTTEEMLVGQ
ncbi:MAG TPA: hypothetical protein VMG58_17010 [Candidatus Sulfotelmatobacter sp.]|nr:hypothetical protein [Candidatus Sulfotelmatobacter sp.]